MPASSKSSGRSGPRSSKPRWLSPVTAKEIRDGDGADVVEFLEAYCRITKDTIAGRAGEPLIARSWQRDLIGRIFARRADGRRKHRQALVGIARKNGKTALLAGIGLYGLLAEDTGAEVYSVAGDREQARLSFGAAKRMVELDEELSDHTKLYRDAIEVPETGSVYRVLSAEAPLKEGLSPTLVCFDELHVQPDDELWNVMTLGSGARVDPLVLAITTAGARTDNLGRDTICYRLYQHGRRVATGEVADPSFFFAWWEPKKGGEADHRDPRVWREGNPAFGDLIDPEDFASTVVRTPEAEFRTKRTNVWVTSNDPALPHGAWEKRADPTRVPEGETILFFDGSWSGDSTGIVGCTVEEPHLFVVDVWERPDTDQGDWRVPVADVKARILETCRSMPVRLVVCDPYRWQQTFSDLEVEGIPVAEFATNSVARMVTAWKRFYDAILDGTVTHDGNPTLARHVENMRLKIDAAGARPTKEHKASRRHIDLGICAVGAYDVIGTLQPSEEEANLW